MGVAYLRRHIKWRMFISSRKFKKTKTSYMSYYNIEVKGLNQNKTSEVDGVKNELIVVGTVHCRIRERDLCFLQAFNGIYNRSGLVTGNLPEEEAIQNELHEMVRKAVVGLDEKYRIPVYWFYTEQLTV